MDQIFTLKLLNEKATKEEEKVCRLFGFGKRRIIGGIIPCTEFLELMILFTDGFPENIKCLF